PILTAGAVRAAALNADVADFVDARAEVVSAGVVEAGALLAVQAQIGTLSEIVDDAGSVVAGRFQNPAGTTILDRGATGSDPILRAGSWLSISQTGATFS